MSEQYVDPILYDEEYMKFIEEHARCKELYFEEFMKPLTEEEEKMLELARERNHLSDTEEEVRYINFNDLSEEGKEYYNKNYYDHMKRFPPCKTMAEFERMMKQEQENLKKLSEEKKHSEESYKSLRFGCPKTWNKLEEGFELKQKRGDYFSHDSSLAFLKNKQLVDKMYYFGRQFRRFSLR